MLLYDSRSYLICYLVTSLQRLDSQYTTTWDSPYSGKCFIAFFSSETSKFWSIGVWILVKLVSNINIQEGHQISAQKKKLYFGPILDAIKNTPNICTLWNCHLNRPYLKQTHQHIHRQSWLWIKRSKVVNYCMYIMYNTVYNSDPM